MLIEDGYGGLESVSDAGIIFTPSIYVYPEGSSSIEGSNKNISTNLVNEKDFSDDLDYTVGDFYCHHVRYINIWDTATHCCEDPFSRSYGVSLPSSLTMNLSTPQYVLPVYLCRFAVRVPKQYA